MPVRSLLLFTTWLNIMEIKFIVDYRGVLTNEVYFVAGSVVSDELTSGQKTALVAEGRAVAVDESPPPLPAPTKKPPTRRRKRTARK